MLSAGLRSVLNIDGHMFGHMSVCCSARPRTSGYPQSSFPSRFSSESYISVLASALVLSFVKMPFSELYFNVDNGYLEGLVRGFKAGILSQADYLNLVQCETLEGESSVRSVYLFSFIYTFLQIVEHVCTFCYLIFDVETYLINPIINHIS